MKILIPLAASLFLLLDPNGCDDTSKTTATTPAVDRPFRRFEPVSNHGTSDVALDTVTGRLCRTWEWEYRPANNPAKGGLDTLPTCESIYTADKQKPIVVSPQDMKTP